TVCTLLTMWANIDSYVFLLASPGSLLPTTQNPDPCQDDDDDYILDLTGRLVSKALRGAHSPPLPSLRRLIAVANTALSRSSHRGLLMMKCEHENRNRISMPLLC